MDLGPAAAAAVASGIQLLLGAGHTCLSQPNVSGMASSVWPQMLHLQTHLMCTLLAAASQAGTMNAVSEMAAPGTMTRWLSALTDAALLAQEKAPEGEAGAEWWQLQCGSVFSLGHR